ncbi:MAG TPA: zinc ribbon domain-containing protein [Syntrophomonas sp.]|nr:zinc ribbon domain-containing protein [Syntrophomonas sp.]
MIHMFFVGIFGIEQGKQQIGVYNNTVCPVCHALTSFKIYKSYSCFHVFFIPTFKWDVKYFIKSACCSHISALDPAIGQQYEAGRHPEIEKEHLQPVNLPYGYKTCAICGTSVDPRYHFCPNCGQKL